MEVKEIIRQFQLHQIDIEDCKLQISNKFENNDFTKDDIDMLGSLIALSVIDCETFFNILQKCVNTYGLNITKTLGNTLYVLYHKCESEFVEQTKNLIVNNLGSNRQIGRCVWDSMGLVHSDFDPLQLDSEQQMRFIISMLQDIGNPEMRLPKVMPLFNSEDQSVRSILYICLIIYSNNYFGFVNQEFKSHKYKDSDELLKFELYCKQFDEFLNLRCKCKELLPQYTQNDVYEEAKRAVITKMKLISKDVDKNLKEKSIAQFFSYVCLARGAGWRKPDGSIQPLAHISQSIPYPMMVNAMSGLENMVHFIKRNNDWDKIKDICDIL